MEAEKKAIERFAAEQRAAELKEQEMKHNAEKAVLIEKLAVLQVSAASSAGVHDVITAASSNATTTTAEADADDVQSPSESMARANAQPPVQEFDDSYAEYDAL